MAGADPSARLRGRWGRSSVGARINVVVAAVSVAALLVAGTAALAATHQELPSQWQLLLLLALLPIAEVPLLHVRFGSDRFSFTWGEAAIVVGFSMVSPAWVVIVAWPAVVAAHLAIRRSWQKSVFNGGTFAVSAGVGALVSHLLNGGQASFAHPLSLLVLFVAVTAFSLTSGLVTSVVVATAQQTRIQTVLGHSWRMLVVVWVGNVAVAGTVLFLAERSSSTLLGLPPLMVAVAAIYRGYLAASKERDAWQQLEAAARELNKLEETEVAEAAISRARQMFRTSDVALELVARRSVQDRAYVLDADGLLVLGHGLTPSDPADDLFLGGRSPRTTCVVAPLAGPTGRLGALRLSFSTPVRLSARERQVLSTYAHSVSTTLLNAYLYSDVRDEAVRQAYDASHDPLTGLANRTLLNGRTTEALAAGEGTTALLLLDLDHFKEINDTLGHAAGDLLLQEVARRLRRSVKAEDLVARLGGDEFAILLTGLADPASAEPIATRVLTTLGEPVEYEGLHLSVEASIGIACFPDDAATAEELFRRCDVAMYQAKTERGAWLRYDPLRDDTSVTRLALVGELRAALDDQLVVHFQPQVDLTNGTVVGAEALVRWNHPVRGLLQPSEFVGVAEQSGLVRPFTLKVLDMAVAACVAWQAPGRPLSVAVNLGARSLLDRQLPEDVAGVLARHGLPPQCLVLEITETTATSELEIVEEVLGRLRRLGVEISVDDFGTGYSSLAFLQRTAVHELKVDRSFVSGMLVNDNDLALVRATVHLAHSLGARAVAEGVESQALAVALTSLGCDVAQGYHFGRPMPAEQLEVLLRGEPLPQVPVPRPEGDRHLSAVRGA
jgi:diguanylate cyclase (GGDEF)-like protein